MLKIVLLLCASLNCVAAVEPSKIGPLIYDAFRTVNNESFLVKEARDYGYPIDEELITTEDGYILKVFRMHPSPTAPCKMRTPVYIHHGLSASSDFWLLTGPKRALAYILSDAGCDVWLGNARGSMYSRKHKKISTNSKKFWQFSYHEIAIYDNPAVIDYILAKTNQSQLHYIGHSQGCTTFFVLNALKTEYNKKFKTMHGLAPVIYLKNQISPFFTFATNHSHTLNRLRKRNGFHELLPNLSLFSLLAETICDPQNVQICFGLFRILGGQSPLQEDSTIFPQVFKIFPAGSSMLQLIHYTQNIKNGDFKMFDYGLNRNLRRYGTPTPPDYPLENVVASPIYLYFSRGDYITQISDVERLVERLPKKPISYEIEDKQFGHLDFSFGRHAKELVYDKIVEAIKVADDDGCMPR